MSNQINIIQQDGTQVDVTSTEFQVVVTTSDSSTVVTVTEKGPKGNKGDKGEDGADGSFPTSGSYAFAGTFVITGSLIVSSSNTFINQGPAQFTGSVEINGDLLVNGSNITSTSASFAQDILSNSNSISILSSSFNSVSSSNSIRLDSLEQFSSSLNNTFTTDAELNAATASLSTSIAYLSGSYINDSSSFDFRILTNSSSISLLSGSYLTDSGSFSIRVTSLEQFSASLNDTFATDFELNVATASLSDSISYLSSSFLLFSSSYNTGSFTGSFIGTASYAIHSLTASYALNAGGTNFDTGSFVTTSSFNQFTSSYYIDSASFSSNINLLTSATSSYVLNSQTSSMIVLSSSFAVTASYAETANSVNTLNQNVLISGGLTVLNGVTVYGSSSFTYITASQLAVSASTISVNVFEPVQRFGGLIIYDSGSSQATASFLWDSLHNHFIYQNVSGSTYSGAMFLSGPRNTGSLGDEPTLTRNFIPRSDGDDHLYDTQIYSSGSITQITGSLTVTEGITASLEGTASWSQNSTTASYYQETDPIFVNVSGSLATTSSNVFKGTQTIDGNLFMSGSFRLVYNNDPTTNMLFGQFDGGTIHGPYYQQFGNQYPNTVQRGGAEIIYDIRNNPNANFHISSFNGSTWTQKLLVNDNETQITGSLIVTNGITGSLFGTASVANSASWATYALTASYLNSYIPPFPYTGSAAILGSLTVTSGVTASLFGTASWAENSLTASYVLNAISSSKSVSSSYALTASYALNAGGGSGAGFPYSGSAVITGSLTVSVLYSPATNLFNYYNFI